MNITSLHTQVMQHKLCVALATTYSTWDDFLFLALLGNHIGSTFIDLFEEEGRVN